VKASKGIMRCLGSSEKDNRWASGFLKTSCLNEGTMRRVSNRKMIGRYR
jgi:hypothetical protein